jgi:L-asparaginase
VPAPFDDQLTRGSRDDKTGAGVLVIYTGGTIGSKPSQPDDPESPQVVVPWAELAERTPELGQLPYPIDAYEGIEPLDSCNIGPAHWTQMAEAIAAYYNDYEGFVILHGTDTLVYTASALSFMLRELGKPVIITGSQRSALVDIRNDATQNTLTAIQYANASFHDLPLVPEVAVYFGGKLLRGNRSIKRDTTGYDAYESPNLEHLGEAGDKLTVNSRLVRAAPTGDFHIRTNFDTQVLPIFVSPGIQDTEMVKRQLETPGLRAAVVQAFGSGNIPTDPEFLDLFRAAHRRGVVLAAVSQCRTGPVELGIYETSAELLESGFVAASDITLEAAQCKLMSLLGDEDASQSDIEANYQRSLAGEQTTSLILSRYPESAGNVSAGAGAARKRIKGELVTVPSDRGQIEQVLLRLRRARLVAPVPEGESPPPVTIRLFADVGGEEELPGTRDSRFLGEFIRYPKADGSEALLVFKVTNYFRARYQAGEKLSLTVVVDTPSASLEWSQAELALYAADR